MMAVNYARIVLTEEDRIKYLLPWLRVQPAGVEEARGEVDVHVAEEEQHVAPLHARAPTSRPLPRENSPFSGMKVKFLKLAALEVFSSIPLTSFISSFPK